MWGNCIPTGDELFKWVKTFVNSIKKTQSPLMNQIPTQGLLSENAPNKTQDASLFEELQNKKVFMDAANEDKAMLPQLERKLESEGIKSITSTPQNDDPTEMFNQLEHALDDCDEVITFYNEAPLSWLTQRLRLYRKAQAKRKDRLTIRIHSPNTQPQGIKLPPNARWETA
jgi:hypothetical protein